MESEEIAHWLGQSERRSLVVTCLTQPVTAAQLARRLELCRESVSDILGKLLCSQIVRCLNWRAKSSRLYWLTERGVTVQRRLRQALELPYLEHDFPQVDWDTYGWVCYSHRVAIINVLARPMRPATIRRRAKSQRPGLRMSANNVRDVIRLFNKRGIVRRLSIKRKCHPYYELSELGRKLRVLLLYA